jgi:hypothetical protein
MLQSVGGRRKCPGIKKARRPFLWDITQRDVSGEPIGPTRCVTSQKSADLIYFAGKPENGLVTEVSIMYLRKMLGNASKSVTAVFPSRFSGCGYRAYWLEY